MPGLSCPNHVTFSCTICHWNRQIEHPEACRYTIEAEQLTRDVDKIGGRIGITIALN